VKDIKSFIDDEISFDEIIKRVESVKVHNNFFAYNQTTLICSKHDIKESILNIISIISRDKKIVVTGSKSGLIEFAIFVGKNIKNVFLTEDAFNIKDSIVIIVDDVLNISINFYTSNIISSNKMILFFHKYNDENKYRDAFDNVLFMNYKNLEFELTTDKARAILTSTEIFKRAEQKHILNLDAGMVL